MLKVIHQEERLLEISGDATVYEADKLYAALTALRLASKGEIRIDLANLAALDVAGAQILIAFRRHLGATRVSLNNFPAHILDTVKLGGLDRHLR
jgi:ABC-type transporter Mla MlaB component